MKKLLLIGLSFVACVALAQSASAQTPAEFYRGKTITMLIAGDAGGGYDVYARAFARHMSKHIPGNPDIIPKNQPAGFGLAAANTLYAKADKDGLTMASFTNNVPMDPLFGNPAAHYDPLKMVWLGSIGKLQNVCATWHTSPVKTLEQAREKEIFVGAAGATSNTALMPRISNELLGTKFKIVGGYNGANDLTLSIEKGEVEGICGLSWSTMKASRPHWIRDHLLNVIVQMGLDKLPDLPNVPSALDLVSDPVKKRVLELILIRQETGRPFALPPGVPQDRADALKAAFSATLKDPEFVAEAKKLQLEIDPLSGDQVTQLLTKAYGAPLAIVNKAAALLNLPGKKT